MRLAPAVATTASNAGAWRGGQVLVLAGSAGVSMGWALVLAGLSAGMAWSAAAAAAVIVALLAWRRFAPVPTRLTWTGTAWQLHVPGAPGAVDLRAVEAALDLGPALLLRARAAVPDPAARDHWLMITRAEAGPDFRGLCVALYADLPSEPSPAWQPLAPTGR